MKTIAQLMEEYIAQYVQILTTDGEVVKGCICLFEDEIDNDDGDGQIPECSISVVTRDKDIVLLFESDIKSIEPLRHKRLWIEGRIK